MPSEALVPVAGLKVIPPIEVVTEKVTVWPAIGLPPASNTLKITADASGCPVPLRPITLGVAEMNWMPPSKAEETLIVPVAFRVVPLIVVLAVMVSLPLHPLAT